ncbi:DUF5675 family protein [Methylobacillus flagellatus]|uniref:DUF5675 family protein n=1 Tax=Methylobacillus flagellatus TaxID=405 RepID=UPI0010F555CA|nr:DUF5675 family protein [Methylobacillus flagellatus]
MSPMTVVLQRNEGFTAGYTAGRLMLDGQLICYTLEDECREVAGQPVETWKVKGATCIPRGRYRVVLTKSPRFGRVLPELLLVPGFTAIRIHSGNTAAHTEGCPLVGMEDGNPNDGWLGRSREAEGQVVALFKEAIHTGREVWIEVRGGGR